MTTDRELRAARHLDIPDLAASRVLVVGDIMLDSYLYGSAERMSPEAPVPVLKVDREEFRIGGAGNVAVNVAALGAQATLLALVGNDLYASTLQEMIADTGVGAKLIVRDQKGTILKRRVVAKNHQLLRMDYERPFGTEDADHILSNFEQLLPDFDVVVLSDYAKGALYHAAHMIDIARSAGKPVLIDPKGKNFTKYQGATLITPNLNEFEVVMGHCKDDDDIASQAAAMLEKFNLSAVLVTKSERGMTLVQRGEQPLHLPTMAREVYDVTGAGDSVIATVAAALGANAPLSVAIKLSNAAAGVVVGKFGTATASISELHNYMQHQRQNSSGKLVKSLAELKNIVTSVRAEGEVLVLTNGCFDLLHPGHIDYLQRARQLGDRLIVLVNDDASISKIKGRQRPINDLNFRQQMLAALECVDYVCHFETITPDEQIKFLNPDILVKGGDYEIGDIVGSEFVLKKGGQVKVLPFVEGYSSTNIIEKIKRG